MTGPAEPRAVIVDDEAVLRRHLRTQLRALWPELTICGEAGDGVQALRLIEAEHPQIVFLDIRMPGLDGLRVAERVGSDCQIVFVTAYDEFAVRAFEQAAADYLLKPVSDIRLAKTIDRLHQRLRQPESANAAELLRHLQSLLAPESGARWLRWIKASKQDEILIVPVTDVLCFESDKKYTTVVMRNEELLIRKPIKELEQELDPDTFWRVHRSLIVNVAAVERTERDFAGRLWVRLRGVDRKLPVSRAFAHRFKQM